ncbi:MAG: transglutaminase domain-containing protein [Candidatus Hydrogenedentes bacterium]|nr:transglutaminase domain-containing protein [Candidatus Hydrogenedentota bacterium]
MKRVVIMVTLMLFPRVLAAQSLDLASLEGENWYGLYLNGQKSGYSMHKVEKAGDGTVVVIEDARFRLNMAGVPQDMRMFAKRTYAADGRLQTVEQQIDDAKGASKFLGVVQGEELVLHAEVGGTKGERRMPRPKESLEDALKQAELVRGNPQVGASLTFTTFEPMKPGEIKGHSEIVGVEERTLEGAPTKVYQIKTSLDFMGIETISYVTEKGTTLEDITAGQITMRLEPKEIAQDVDYSNDVIVSNAAMVSAPISDPRTRKELHLRLKGPLSPAHLFNDERQFLSQSGDAYDFTGKAMNLEGFTAVPLPVNDEQVSQWLKPTMFVQNDDPRILAKAREIVGDEKDSLKASALLCEWVYKNVDTVFSARLTNALEVLDSLEGDCTEHSILFVALARAAGLPSREVAGLIYMDGGKPGFYFHQWAKVWVGKWIDVDPTWNQPLADVTHIKLAEGDLFQQAQIIPIIGQIRVEVVEQASGG